MGYEAALQRVTEIRSLAGDDGVTGSSAAASPTDSAAFATQLALTMTANGGTGAPVSTASNVADVMTLPNGTQIPVLSLTSAGVAPTGQQLPAGAVGARMVELAKGELGVSESGGTNDSARIRTYRAATAGAENSPGPWCAYFVSWLAKEAGAPVGPNGNGTGYVPTLEAWGRQTGRYFARGEQPPQPGDIVVFDWGRDGTADHTGIVERVDTDGRMHTIEGNSSNSVRRREYAADAPGVRGFVRSG